MIQSGVMVLHIAIPSVQKSSEGSYRCVISNFADDETSNPAKLEVG